MKRYIIILIYLISTNCFSQSDPVLIRINGEEITRSEFEYSYLNSSGKTSPKEYIDEFINNKLKIAEALSSGMDSGTAFQSEMNNYRRQLTREYISHETVNEPEEQQTLNPTGKTVMIEGYHIYKYLPQSTPRHEINRINAQFDSLHTELYRNPSLDFREIVEKYSDDKNLFSVRPLDVPEEFENEVFYAGNNEISKPFFTPQGIHIVKILRKYDSSLLEQPEYMNRHQVWNNKFSKKNYQVIEKLKNEYNYNPNQSALSELTSTGKSNQQTLFSINGRPYTMTEFEHFSQDHPRGREAQVEEFIAKSLFDYEISQLGTKHPEFNAQMNWHRDEILLNEINNRKIGDIQTWDPKNLETYFEANKKDYYWDLPRYKGIVVHCDNKRTGKKIKKQLKKIPQAQWVDFLNQNYNLSSQPKVIVEKGTYAVGQNDFVDKLVFKVGKYTPVKSHPFTFVMGEKIKGPESYEEIRELVAVDYRNSLETRWLKQLRSKSKVEINQEVLKTVNNQ